MSLLSLNNKSARPSLSNFYIVVSKSPESAKIEPMSSIFDISYEMNGPLPFYHPNHIIHYVMWGKMDLVHTVLISLNNFFKQFVDDDDNMINEFPPVSFPKMLKLQNVSND